MRREAEEREGEWREAAGGEREDARERTGNRLDAQAALARDTNDAITGIGDHRHARVADQCQRLAALDAIDEARRFFIFVVLVIAVGRTIDAEVREQLPRVPRVLAQNQIGRLQRIDRARRHVRQIAEGRADDEEFAGHRGRRVYSAAKKSRNDRNVLSGPVTIEERRMLCEGSRNPDISWFQWLSLLR